MNTHASFQSVSHPQGHCSWGVGHPGSGGGGNSGGRGRRFGFTLVEMLLAMVLTAVLMTALMMVASSSMQDRQRLADRQAEATPGWIHPVARQIEADLLMGSGVSGPVRVETPGGGTRCYILTQNATAPGSVGNRRSQGSGATHLPCLVSYRLVSSDQGGVLLREERSLASAEGIAGTAALKSEVQVVATGVAAIEIGGTTLSLEDDRQHPIAEPLRSSVFTILVNNRPIAMQAIGHQTRLAINTTGTAPDHNDLRDNPQRIYERTLLTQ